MKKLTLCAIERDDLHVKSQKLIRLIDPIRVRTVSLEEWIITLESDLVESNAKFHNFSIECQKLDGFLSLSNSSSDKSRLDYADMGDLMLLLPLRCLVLLRGRQCI